MELLISAFGMMTFWLKVGMHLAICKSLTCVHYYMKDVVLEFHKEDVL